MIALRRSWLAALCVGMSLPLAGAAAQTLAGAAAAPMAGYGGSVVVGDGEVLVGEPNNTLRSGMVYIYGRGGAGWAQRAALKASDAADADGFGASMAMDGSTLVVGAIRQADRHGAVYVFQRSGTAWRQTARLVAPDGAEGDGFGAAVVVHGDEMLVAAPGRRKNVGAVYAFHRSGTSWSPSGVLEGDSTMSQPSFGAAVALAGDQALVGAPGAADRKGQVLVYTRAATGWTSAGTLSPANLEANDRFGSTLVAHGTRVLAGAPRAANATGAVLIFERDSSGAWKEQSRLVAFQATRLQGFGAAVAADGDQLLVGAPQDDGLRGALYHFDRGTDGWTSSRKIIMERRDRGDLLGASLDVRGNVAAAGIVGVDHGTGGVLILERDPQTNAWRQQAVLKGPPEAYASITGKEVRCSDAGQAAQFECRDVELVSFMSVADLGGERGVRLNDVWGWTDAKTGREYALVGRIDGTAFVDITDAEHPKLLGSLPKTVGSNASVWRDVKVYKDHAYIVADGAGAAGMQVFDLTRLRDVKGAPATFTADAHYDRINSAHNIVINEGSGFAYAVGASSGGETCGGGLHMIDIRDPKHPKFAGCFADAQTGRASTGYSHDAQCVMYHGPDQQYQGREICLGANETALSIADVTDKSAPKALARASYPNVGYAHQGWFDDEQRYFYMDDELDELQGLTKQTRTLIWDLSSLDDPQLVGQYLGTTEASDHNLYIKGNVMYQSDYQSGLRVLDISNRTKPVEIGYFDTVPYGTNTAGFGGSWSNYPYFKSGMIIVTSGNEGLFILRKRNPKTAM